MASIGFKYSPAIQDLSAEMVKSSEEGYEAVLYEHKRDETLASKAESKECADRELLQMIENRKWQEVFDRIKAHPETASLDFTGNLVLHEVCKNQPPLEPVSLLIAANETALETRGNSGFLPLHFACAFGASAAVIKLLLDANPEAVRIPDENDNMLPLHHACKCGYPEDVLMALLTPCPEATAIRDDFGRIPLDYARSIHQESARMTAITCLERGVWLHKAATLSRERTEREFEKRIHEIKGEKAKLQEANRKQIETFKAAHGNEKIKLLIDIQEHKANEETMNKRIEDQKAKIHAMKSAYEVQARESDSKFETQKQQSIKAQLSLHVKEEELKIMSSALGEVSQQNETLGEQLKRKMKFYGMALEEIERLNKRLGSVDSLMASIRHLANTPMVTSAELRDVAPDDYTYQMGNLAKARKPFNCANNSIQGEAEIAIPSNKNHIAGPVCNAKSTDEMSRTSGESRTDEIPNE